MKHHETQKRGSRFKFHESIAISLGNVALSNNQSPATNRDPPFAHRIRRLTGKSRRNCRVCLSTSTMSKSAFFAVTAIFSYIFRSAVVTLAEISFIMTENLVR